jgi:hypothetical protein
VSLACNDPDNGIFSGRLLMVEYNGMELTHDHWGVGVAISFLDERTIRVSRRQFAVNWRKSWYGNWCWEAVGMPRKEAHRLVAYLRESGDWHCESAPTRLYEWFNGKIAA